MDNFEQFSDAVSCLETRSSAFQSCSERSRLLIRTRSFKRVWGLVRTRLASCSNPLGFSFEHVFAFRSKAFGFSLQRVSYNDWTRPGCGANEFICGANELGQKIRYTMFLTGTAYDVPASINLIISRFSSSSTLLFFVWTSTSFFFNRQRDYCACAIGPRLCSYNRWFI